MWEPKYCQQPRKVFHFIVESHFVLKRCNKKLKDHVISQISKKRNFVTAYWGKVISFFSSWDHSNYILGYIHFLKKQGNVKNETAQCVSLLMSWHLKICYKHDKLLKWHCGLLLIVVVSPVFERQTADLCRWVMGDQTVSLCHLHILSLTLFVGSLLDPNINGKCIPPVKSTVPATFLSCRG